MARKKRIAPKYVASLKGVLFYFYLGLLAFFLNQDYFLFNEESFLALNSLGFFSVLGFSLRKQVGKLFFFRAHRIFRVFRYLYRIGFRWLRKSVRVAAIGQWYFKQYLFSSDFYYRRLWRPLINRFCKETLKHLSQQFAFFFFSATIVSSTRVVKSGLKAAEIDSALALLSIEE